MNTAWVGVREQPHYRRDAFANGLRECGYDVRLGAPGVARPGDVLVLWNRYGFWHDVATRFEQAGGIVVVAENGYIGPGGVSPHQMQPREWYALAVGGHNGSGTWHVGGPERWEALGVELKPWRTDGKHILVCPNRSFGQPGSVMPERWADDVARRLRAVTDREIRVRPHPGNGKAPPLEPDLRDAHAVVIWSSSVGVQALLAGVPVICEAPAWICRAAAILTKVPVDGAMVEALAQYGDNVARLASLRALSHAQYHVDEIATGEPFARLLEHANKREAAAA